MLFGSVVSASAAALPPNIQPVNTGWISNSDIANAYHVVSYTYISSSNGPLQNILKPTWEIDYDTASAKYSIPFVSDQITNCYTSIVELDRLMSFDMDYLYYFGLWVRLRYGAKYPLPFKSLTITPIYYTADMGGRQADIMHSITLDKTFTSDFNEYTKDTIYEFNKDEYYIPFNPAWLPDGYLLSGFSFSWDFEPSYMPPSVTFMYSGIDFYQYSQNGELAEIIESQTQEITGVIADSTNQLVDQINSQTQEIQDSIDHQTEEIQDSIAQQTEEQKGMFERLGDRISGFFDKLLEGIKSFFIPEDGYFSQYFADWDAWMVDHFGALYYPFDLVLDILNRFLNLEVPDTPSITFPAIQVGETTLLESQTYTFFADDSLPALATLYQTYRVVVTMIFVVALANLAWKKLNEIMGGG